MGVGRRMDGCMDITRLHTHCMQEERRNTPKGKGGQRFMDIICEESSAWLFFRPRYMCVCAFLQLERSELGGRGRALVAFTVLSFCLLVVSDLLAALK